MGGSVSGLYPVIELIGGNWKKLMAALVWRKLPPEVIDGPALPSAEVFEPLLRSAGDGDSGFFGVSMTEPPEFKPVRIFNGLISAFPSEFGDIVIIEPPDKPKRGTLSSFFGTILIPPPHIRNSPRPAAVASLSDGPNGLELVDTDVGAPNGSGSDVIG